MSSSNSNIQNLLNYIKKIKLNELSNQLSSISLMFVKVVGLIATILLIVVTCSELMNNNYKIIAFKVPRTFEERGINGQVVANHLYDIINDFNNHSRKSVEYKLISSQVTGQTGMEMVYNEELHELMNIDLSGVGVDLNNIVYLIRKTLGKESKCISGELMQVDSVLYLTMRIPGFPSVQFEEAINNKGFNVAFKTIIKKGSEKLFEYVMPLSFAYFKYETGNLDEAYLMCEYILSGRLTGNLAAVYNLKGLLAKKEKNYSEAIAYFKLAVKEDKKFTGGYNNWGLCLASLQDYEGAINMYKKVLQIDSKNGAAYNNMGLSLAKLDLLEEAMIYYEKATTINPAFSPAYNNWGLALVKKKQYSHAVDKYRMSIKLNPHSTISYNNLGACLRNMEKYEEARTVYKNSLKLNPHNAKTYNNIAALFLAQGVYDSVFHYANISCEIDKNYGYVYSTTAEAYVKLKKDSTACDMLCLAFRKGYPVKRADKNPLFTTYLNVPRVKVLVDSLNKTSTANSRED